VLTLIAQAFNYAHRHTAGRSAGPTYIHPITICLSTLVPRQKQHIPSLEAFAHSCLVWSNELCVSVYVCVCVLCVFHSQAFSKSSVTAEFMHVSSNKHFCYTLKKTSTVNGSTYQRYCSGVHSK